ncbi:MAG: hypothetical protein HYW49_06520 [Deltaproteobacteria bacterium]|nr:hypothetical protein [Deltaproteobacteria bacterium]
MNPNREILLVREVAKGLGHLSEKVVFVGGATTALYITDSQAPKPTLTDDVDLVIEITSLNQYEALEKQLQKLGFKRDPANPGPLCRFKFKDIDVDIMPTEERILGFSNRFYPEGIKNAIHADAAGESVKIFSVPFFFASKLEAFQHRGPNDLRFSQDLEDIIEVLDGRKESAEEIKAAPFNVSQYIKERFSNLLSDEHLLQEAASGFLSAYGGLVTAKQRSV